MQYQISERNVSVAFLCENFLQRYSVKSEALIFSERRYIEDYLDVVQVFVQLWQESTCRNRIGLNMILLHFVSIIVSRYTSRSVY